MLTHGNAARSGVSPEYRCWGALVQRCTNPRAANFKYYGGRGIKVCERWLGEFGFENFFADMGERPSLMHTVDRRENDGDYTPENCRWATKAEQAQNSSRAKLESHEPSQIRWLVNELKFSQAEVGRFFGVSRVTAGRVARGLAWR